MANGDTAEQVLGSVIKGWRRWGRCVPYRKRLKGGDDRLFSP